MSVQGIGNHAVHQLSQEMRGIQRQESVSQPDANSSLKPSGLLEHDAYLPSEKQEPIGIYKLSRDDEGNPIIAFDNPTKEAAPVQNEPGRKAETCTTNTDQVDREIEKLKEKRDGLEQQLRTTKDPDKAKDLERQLAQVEKELQQKDNDAYRRQNSVIS